MRPRNWGPVAVDTCVGASFPSVGLMSMSRALDARASQCYKTSQAFIPPSPITGASMIIKILIITLSTGPSLGPFSSSAI